MRFQTLSLERLKAAPYRPAERYWPGDPEFDRLRQTILEFAQAHPPVWNEATGSLLAGRNMVKAMADSGATEATVVVVNLTSGRAKALGGAA